MFHDETLSGIHRARAADAATDLMMDEDTFRAFYDRTAKGVWAYLVRLTGDRHIADDLLQESFYRFLRAGGQHESEAHRRNSLYRIATNLARDSRRRRFVLPWRRSGDVNVEALAGRDQAGSTEKATDVTRALARLKPREREMLWLAYAEGASHPEIAQALGLNPSSMKVLLFRARRRLAALLGESWLGGSRS
ncbi:MAG TPA: RNA polymerase sigma factor [Bryobacteraceae bacterium]|jgi:RNA polymerase sigma-70 factor (ECF subfamily)